MPVQSATVVLGADWEPRAEVVPDFTWTDRAHVDVFGIRITFGSKVEPKLRDALAKFVAQVPRLLKELSVPTKAAETWRKAHEPFKVGAAPEIWVRFTPRSAGLSGIESMHDTAHVRIAVEGTTETFVGPRPEPAVQSALPNLHTNVKGTSAFSLVVPIHIAYPVLDEALGRALKLGEARDVDVGNGLTASVVIDRVETYPTDGGRLAVGLTMSADLPSGLLDGRGTIWLTAGLEIDNTAHVVQVADLEVFSDFDNILTEALVRTANLPIVRQRLEAGLRHDFGPERDRLLATAAAHLNRDVGQGIKLKGELDDASVNGAHADRDGLRLSMRAAGRLNAVLVGAGPDR